MVGSASAGQEPAQEARLGKVLVQGQEAVADLSS